MRNAAAFYVEKARNMPSNYSGYRRRIMSGFAVEIQRVPPSENIEKCCRIVKFFAVEIQKITPSENVGFRRRKTTKKRDR